MSCFLHFVIEVDRPLWYSSVVYKWCDDDDDDDYDDDNVSDVGCWA
jgi:hypothetical protein